ncbi:MAG: DUF6049 family protein [Bifidobacterium sp.]
MHGRAPAIGPPTLAKAKQQGYDTVIATHDFEGMMRPPRNRQDRSNHRRRRHHRTDRAKRAFQPCTRQGDQCRRRSGRRGTTAGRLARFVAQSAFYQMEQPYSERNLLVCLNGNSDPPSWTTDDGRRTIAMAEHHRSEHAQQRRPRLERRRCSLDRAAIRRNQ